MNKSERTKNALAKSLRKLIKKEPLSRITVTAIAENCNMNRQTFYYHFHDVSELIGWIYSQEVEKIFERDASANQWRETTLNLLAFIQKNKDFVTKTIHAVDSEYALDHIIDSVRGISSATLDQEPDAKFLSRDNRELIVSFYANGIVGVVLNWVDSGAKDDPESLTNRLEKILDNDIRHAVANLADKD